MEIELFTAPGHARWPGAEFVPGSAPRDRCQPAKNLSGIWSPSSHRLCAIATRRRWESSHHPFRPRRSIDLSDQ